MKIEIRADGAHISGYVNATEKKSRPVMTPHGKVVEVIEPRAFSEAIERAGNITVSADHDQTHIYASTEAGTCTRNNLAEDLKNPLRFVHNPPRVGACTGPRFAI